MKESEYSKDSDWISPPSKGERLGFTFDPLVSCSSSSFLSPALHQSSVLLLVVVTLPFVYLCCNIVARFCLLLTVKVFDDFL